jgi:N-methylhydantoinase B/oxoprolinase/acetone carboxylase alpha subunit
MTDEKLVADLHAEIAGCERDIAKLDDKARVCGMDAFMQIERDGIEICLEQLRDDLRYQLGEPEPVRH